MRLWRRKRDPMTHEQARRLQPREHVAYLDDRFLDSFPTEQEILDHFTSGYSVVIEARVIWFEPGTIIDYPRMRAVVVIRAI